MQARVNGLGVYTSGALTQTGGSVTTDSLEGSVGSISLPSRDNAISGIATGGFVQLHVTDPAGDVLIVTNQPLRIGSPTVAGGLFLQPGRTATLVTDYLTVDPSSGEFKTVNITNGTFVLAPYTAGGSILLTGGTKPTTGLSLTTDELMQIGTPTSSWAPCPAASPPRAR